MSAAVTSEEGTVRIFLGGDVMTGRGIDQILAFPVAPRLHEQFVSTALTYVELAEKRNGPIPRGGNDPYIWGDGLEELERRKPDVRIVNLETAVTTNDGYEPKGINYRMSPSNFSCMTAARIDCCALANNHVLDWGRKGLQETLAVVRASGIATAGAGISAEEAWAPAILPVRSAPGRVLIFAVCTMDCGVPSGWCAGEDKPGVNLIPDLSRDTAAEIIRSIGSARRSGDLIIVSIHWGGNWGYGILGSQSQFAHALIDGGVDIVHGHSSHHAKPIEIHRGRPIIYGCGDLLNDYEGISGHEEYRPDLSVMYFLDFGGLERSLIRFEMVPMQIRNFRLNHASRDDKLWLKDILETRLVGEGCALQLLPSGALGLTRK